MEKYNILFTITELKDFLRKCHDTVTEIVMKYDEY